MDKIAEMIPVYLCYLKFAGGMQVACELATLLS